MDFVVIDITIWNYIQKMNLAPSLRRNLWLLNRIMRLFFLNPLRVFLHVYRIILLLMCLGFLLVWIYQVLVLLTFKVIPSTILNIFPLQIHIFKVFIILVFAVPIDTMNYKERGDTKDHSLTQWFMNFSEADELLKLAAARQQVMAFLFNYSIMPLYLTW